MAWPASTPSSRVSGCHEKICGTSRARRISHIILTLPPPLTTSALEMLLLPLVCSFPAALAQATVWVCLSASAWACLPASFLSPEATSAARVREAMTLALPAASVMTFAQLLNPGIICGVRPACSVDPMLGPSMVEAETTLMVAASPAASAVTPVNTATAGLAVSPVTPVTAATR